MNTDRSKRKLASILSVDVKGHSRLMQDDEDANVRTITAYREVMTNLISENSDRVVDAKDDNLLAEFPNRDKDLGIPVQRTNGAGTGRRDHRHRRRTVVYAMFGIF